MPANCVADDRCWETMTVVKRFCFLHHTILRDRPTDLTTPTKVTRDLNAQHSIMQSEDASPNFHLREPSDTLSRKHAFDQNENALFSVLTVHSQQESLMSTSNKSDTTTTQSINALIGKQKEDFKVPEGIVVDGADLVPTVQHLM